MRWLLRLALSGRQRQKTAGSAAFPASDLLTSEVSRPSTGQPVSYDPQTADVFKKMDLPADAAAAYPVCMQECMQKHH